MVYPYPRAYHRSNEVILGRKPSHIRVAEGLASLDAVLIEMEVERRRALSIKRVHR